MWFADKDKSLNYVPATDEMVLTVHRWFNVQKSCPRDWLYSRLGGSVVVTPDDTVTAFPAVLFTVQVVVDDLNYRNEPSMEGKVNGQTGKGVFTIVEVWIAPNWWTV